MTLNVSMIMNEEQMTLILEQQEKEFNYESFFLPSPDEGVQPYVGDPMPYYEDGIYYIYYLKESGDSLNHSIYLTRTRDFIHYDEKEDALITANLSGQDEWVGTGSLVKADDQYLFFYTGHTFSEDYEYSEKVMLARGSSPDQLEKVEGWEITPAAELMQKLDFRDPQASYDEAGKCFWLTISASCQGFARILKYRVSKDLKEVKYEGILFTDREGIVYNLECTDLFRMGQNWYLTFSAQDGSLYYASSKEHFGPFSDPLLLDGKLFYAAKHVDNGKDFYMVGWGRRSHSPASLTEITAWGGNLMVQKLSQREDGSLCLMPVDAIAGQYQQAQPLLLQADVVKLSAAEGYQEQDIFTVYESFRLSGHFTYKGEGSFGLAFAFGKAEQDKRIEINPSTQTLSLTFGQGTLTMAEVPITIQAGCDYSFTYIQEGSLGTFYIDEAAALTVRIYGLLGKAIRLFTCGNEVTFTCLAEYTK